MPLQMLKADGNSFLQWQVVDPMEATVFLHFHSKCNFRIFRDNHRPKHHCDGSTWPSCIWKQKYLLEKEDVILLTMFILVCTLKHFAFLLFPYRYIFVYFATEVPNLLFL